VRARAAAGRAVAMAATWWILAEGAVPSTWAGGIVALATLAVATAASLFAWPPGAVRLRLRGVPALALHFARQSAAGGVDVARRALLPSGRVRPGFLRYRTDLPPGAPRTILAGVVSLLPGTLAVEIDGPVLVIHMLDRELPVREAIRATEVRIRAAIRAAPGDSR
jgi:multicomponent Na+:H+ antiporter subunit E